MSVEAIAVARPYAAAAFALAREREAVDDWGAVLARFAQVAMALAEGAAKRRLIGAAQQADIILTAAGGDETQAKFLALLAENERLSALPAIAARFDELRLDAAGILRARVESAIAIEGDAEKREFDDFLAKRFGKTVETVYEHNPALIGGLRVYACDDVLDASARGRLDKLAASLT